MESKTPTTTPLPRQTTLQGLCTSGLKFPELASPSPHGLQAQSTLDTGGNASKWNLLLATNLGVPVECGLGLYAESGSLFWCFSGTHNDEMCNFYMMYYTEARSGNQHLSIDCMGNAFPGVFPQLPADNDVALPPNPALEEQAENPNAPHVHMPSLHDNDAADDDDDGGHVDDVIPEVEPQGDAAPAVKKEAGNNHRGRHRFADRVYDEAVDKKDAGVGGGGGSDGLPGSRRYLLNNNFYDDYSDYNNIPYQEYFDYSFPSRRRGEMNRYNQRAGSTSSARSNANTAHAFFGFGDEDANRDWGWQQQGQGARERPGALRGGAGREGGGTRRPVMGGPPPAPATNQQRRPAANQPNQAGGTREQPYNLQSDQKPNNQFLPRQRAGAARPMGTPQQPGNKQQQQPAATGNKATANGNAKKPLRPKAGGSKPSSSKSRASGTNTSRLLSVHVQPSLFHSCKRNSIMFFCKCVGNILLGLGEGQKISHAKHKCNEDDMPN